MIVRLDHLCDVLHAAVAHFRGIGFENHVEFQHGGKCFLTSPGGGGDPGGARGGGSPGNRLPIRVLTLRLYSGLNHKTFWLRFCPSAVLCAFAEDCISSE